MFFLGVFSLATPRKDGWDLDMRFGRNTLARSMSLGCPGHMFCSFTHVKAALVRPIF